MQERHQGWPHLGGPAPKDSGHGKLRKVSCCISTAQISYRSSCTHLTGTGNFTQPIRASKAPSIGCWSVALLPPQHTQALAGNTSTGLHSLARQRCLEASLPLHPHLPAKPRRWQLKSQVDFVSMNSHAENITEWQVHDAYDLM